MSTWVIGDLQGCGQSFAKLRESIGFSAERDTLVLVGDLVNRGSTSLETLRWVVQNDASVRVVLGNHDLHLLWCALGAGTPKGRDTIQEIIDAPDCDLLISWLRRQPFVRYAGDALIVHAGLHPSWSVEDAQRWSDKLSARLQADDAGAFLDRVRARFPKDDDEKQLFFAHDVLTRMRTLSRRTLELDEHYSGPLDDVPEGRVPWFRVRALHPRPKHVFFGHWAALGFHSERPYTALDSGCVWGRGLTAWRLEDGYVHYEPAIDTPPVMTDGQRRNCGFGQRR